VDPAGVVGAGSNGLHKVFFEYDGLVYDFIDGIENGVYRAITGGGGVVFVAVYGELHRGHWLDGEAGEDLHHSDFDGAGGGDVAHDEAEVVVGELFFAVGDFEEFLVGSVERGWRGFVAEAL